MKKHSLILFIFSIIFSLIAKGQIYHSDPYKIDHSYFNIEQSRQEILNNKVKLISSFDNSLKKNGSKKKKSKLNYRIEFNEYGNPINYYSSYVMECWWFPALKQKLGLEKRFITTYNYSFQYDSLNKLIHLKEKIVETHSPAYEENDINFYYNKENLLNYEIISEKYIYKNGYKYRGVAYTNDTTLSKYYLNYDNSNKVKYVIKWSSSNGENINKKVLDTINFNCTFDSIFIKKSLPKGIKLDTLGRIVESTLHMFQGTLIGGGNYTREMPNDLINNYTYDISGRLVLIESKTRSGNYVSKEIWTYDKNGFLKSKHFDGSMKTTFYEYEFLKKTDANRAACPIQ